MDQQGKWSLEMECTPGEDAMESVEMTTKGFEYYIHLVDKAVAGFQRTDSNFEISSTVGKILPNTIACYRETMKGRVSRGPFPPPHVRIRSVGIFPSPHVGVCTCSTFTIKKRGGRESINAANFITVLF